MADGKTINDLVDGMRKLTESFKEALRDAKELNNEISKSQSMKELNKLMI